MLALNLNRDEAALLTQIVDVYAAELKKAAADGGRGDLVARLAREQPLLRCDILARLCRRQAWRETPACPQTFFNPALKRLPLAT